MSAKLGRKPGLQTAINKASITGETPLTSEENPKLARDKQTLIEDTRALANYKFVFIPRATKWDTTIVTSVTHNLCNFFTITLCK